MNHYEVDVIKAINGKIYVIREHETLKLMAETTKYLEHKRKTRCSQNTIRKIAFSLSYYLSFLKEMGMKQEEVLLLNYEKQQEHFVNFLSWLKDGNHTDRKKIPRNNTCNSYLEAVFGYYEFLLLVYEKDGDINVLEERDISYSSSVGVKFSKSIKTFSGYLPKEKSKGKTIQKEKIPIILDATKNVRDKLLILLLCETGFRIGELLGIRYEKDIDYKNMTISVEFRENNENDARAKNAEIRRSKISKDTFDILLFYLSEYRELLKNTEYLFICIEGETAGRPYNVNAVYSLLNSIKKRTGIKVTPHMLRHYFANERRKSGWALDMISKALGHKSIYTTELYMNIEDEEMADAMKEFYENNEGLYDLNKLI